MIIKCVTYRAPSLSLWSLGTLPLVLSQPPTPYISFHPHAPVLSHYLIVSAIKYIRMVSIARFIFVQWSVTHAVESIETSVDHQSPCLWLSALCTHGVSWLPLLPNHYIHCSWPTSRTELKLEWKHPFLFCCVFLHVFLLLCTRECLSVLCL